MIAGAGGHSLHASPPFSSQGWPVGLLRKHHLRLFMDHVDDLIGPGASLVALTGFHNMLKGFIPYVKPDGWAFSAGASKPQKPTGDAGEEQTKSAVHTQDPWVD